MNEIRILSYNDMTEWVLATSSVSKLRVTASLNITRRTRLRCVSGIADVLQHLHQEYSPES